MGSTLEKGKEMAPLAAILVAVLGWYDARDVGKDAVHDVTQISRRVDGHRKDTIQLAVDLDERSYDALRAVIIEQHDRITALEQDLGALSGIVLDALDEDEDDSPRERREKRAVVADDARARLPALSPEPVDDSSVPSYRDVQPRQIDDMLE